MCSLPALALPDGQPLRRLRDGQHRPHGGTPGRANATRATNPDRLAPALLRAVALSPTTVRLYFGEKLDKPELRSKSTGNGTLLSGP